MGLFKKKDTYKEDWQTEIREDVQTKSAREKLDVEILGKGFHPVTVDETTTVQDLRDILNIQSNVQAVDKSGKPMSNETKILSKASSKSGKKKVSFVPNVVGGWQTKK